MYRKRYSFLFASVLLAFVVPFMPAALHKSSAANDTDTLPSLKASIEASDIFRRGYATFGLFGVVPDGTVLSATDEPVPAVTPTAAPSPPPEIFTHPLLNARVTVAGATTMNPSPYEAVVVARSSDVINVIPGKALTVWVDFLNTGTATWTNNGSHFIALNVTHPAGRTSAFQHPFWKSSYRPAVMRTNQVKPGETGRVAFALRAPKTPGVYTESFQLVAENLTWISGSTVTFTIGVGERVTPPQHWKARETARSSEGTLKMDPGQARTAWISFANDGTVPWFRSGNHFVAVNTTDPAGRTSTFRHPYWRANYRAGLLSEKYVRPGEVGTFRIALQAPTTPGIYTENFQLVAENLAWIDGGKFSLTIQVGDPLAIQTVTQETGEPTIRVGLFQTSQPVTVTASGTYDVWDGSSVKLSTEAAAAQTTVITETGSYTVTSPSGTWTTLTPPRFIPSDTTVIMEITSFENRPSWNTALNDNRFRGTLEVRSATGGSWVIDELPLESYLRGVAESSNGSPIEYLKALAIAERSYTLWHYLAGGKDKINDFTVNATTDQVYRGYGFELRSQDPLTAVTSTSGTVITHPEAISPANQRGVAVTPYSSGTDGRTRGWSEVWSGNFPWLLSVEDPYGIISNALTLSGNHMVGMSAKGALGYAQNGKTSSEILIHYYSGIAVEKVY